MSDSTQQYILKQPIEGTFRSPEYYGKEVYEVVLKTETLMHRFQPVAKDVFEAMYQLLDIPSIEKQLELIVRKVMSEAFWRGYETETTGSVDTPKKEVAEAIKELKVLFGLENKETEQ